jgi:hypothetical protein
LDTLNIEGDPALCWDLCQNDIAQGMDAYSVNELQDCRRDILHIFELDPDTLIWSDFVSLIDVQLEARSRIDTASLSYKIAQDIDAMLSNKDAQQLKVLESQIEHKLKSLQVVDTDYWEAVLNALVIKKSWSQLQESFAPIRTRVVGYIKEKKLVPFVMQDTTSKDADEQLEEQEGRTEAEITYIREYEKTMSKDEKPFPEPPVEMPYVPLFTRSLRLGMMIMMHASHGTIARLYTVTTFTRIADTEKNRQSRRQRLSWDTSLICSTMISWTAKRRRRTALIRIQRTRQRTCSRSWQACLT